MMILVTILIYYYLPVREKGVELFSRDPRAEELNLGNFQRRAAHMFTYSRTNINVINLLIYAPRPEERERDK